MDLRRMAMLATVVESGSMRRASRALGLTPSAVSQQIRQLERETGVTLLRRSTRRLVLTDAGEAFYEGCASMLAAARSAHERLTGLQQGVLGELSVSAPVGFAGTHLVPALAPLLEAHPKLSLRLVATDDLVDLMRERIDIAIAIGTMPPATSLIRRHLADWTNIVVAAPAYLEAHGTPRTASELAAHDFVALPAWHHGGDVMTAPDGSHHRIGMKRRVTSNNQLTLKQLALAGCGLCLNVEPELLEELHDGRLVRVLQDWSLPVLSVDALLPPRTNQPAKVRAALDALSSYLSHIRPAGRRAPPARNRSASGRKAKRRSPRT
jgi:LysR family transcriptional regulator, transcriptional activator for aaeXAB operon